MECPAPRARFITSTAEFVTTDTRCRGNEDMLTATIVSSSGVQESAVCVELTVLTVVYSHGVPTLEVYCVF